jgi:phosphate transport system substrate-binding protein
VTSARAAPEIRLEKSHPVVTVMSHRAATMLVKETSPAPREETKETLTPTLSRERERDRKGDPMKRRILILAALLLTPSAAFAGTVTVKGSDTMVVLGQRWAEEFMKKNPGTSVQVTGGGSGTGISALINGTTDICQSSRSIKDSEKKQLQEKGGATATEIPVAKDGLAVYVHASNPIKELTMAQLKAIFTGKISNWKDLGGPDKTIIPYSRENSSGTYVFFKEHVLENADYTPKAQTMPGTAAVVNAVSKEKFAIGYGGAAYAKNIRVVNVKKDDGSPAIAPSDKTVKDGSYALSRPLFFYVRNDPQGAAKALIDWVLSKDGQGIVQKVGYYPIK